jgi:hypothetical protein
MGMTTSRTYVLARWGVPDWIETFVTRGGFALKLSITVRRLPLWLDRVVVEGRPEAVAAFEESRLATRQEMEAW